MEFARELATRFAYVDLAEEVLADLEARSLADAEKEALGLLKCDVYAAGAKGEPDAERRLELYDKALEAFQEYLEQNPFSDYLPKAQSNYVDLVNNYGRVLQIKLDEVVGDEAEAIREKIRSATEDGLNLTGDLIDALEGAESQIEKNERWRLMLNRGQMLLNMASVSENGTFMYGQAEQTLEDLALEAGETSGAGLNAYILLAQVKMSQGLYEDAAVFSEFVVNTVIPSDPNVRAELGWDELSFDEKVGRWRLAEVGIGTLVEAYDKAGYPESAANWALHFINMRQSEGFDLSAIGNLGLLACSRALLNVGGAVGGSLTQGDLRWFETEEAMESAGFSGVRNARTSLDLALKLAQDVNNDNRGNTLQIRAQKVISGIIERPGVVVSPDILFEAAEGDYLNGDYARAVSSFKGIMSQLDGRDEATVRQYAPKVYWRIGMSMRKLERPIEAAMAFREAVTSWKGDPEYDEKAANGYYAAMKEVGGAKTEDPLLKQLYLESENLLTSVSENVGSIKFRQGGRAYDQKDYEAARKLFLEVEPGDDSYEKALVKASLCLYKQNDIEAAKEGFRSYLEEYVEDPANAIIEEAKKQARLEARAQATYYLGVIAHNAEESGEVVRVLGPYATEFPAQDGYGPPALNMVVLSHVKLGDIESAKAVVDTMVEKFPSSAFTGRAAKKLHDVFAADQAKAEESGDTETSQALKSEMATYMHLYNETAKNPGYGTLRNESTLWKDLGRWTEAEAVLRKMLAKFEGDPERAEDLEKFILPDLGLALLEQKRVPEAFEVLDPLIPKTEDDPRKPSKQLITSWCRAVSGWVEGDAANLVEVAGVGGNDNFKVATDLLLRLTTVEKQTAGAWTCPWYHIKFDTAYAYYQWGTEDSTQTAKAANLISNLKDLSGDVTLSGIAEACGDDVLQRRFDWLAKKL